MEDRVMIAKGANGTLELLPDRIRIVRAGWLSNLYDHHERIEMPLQQITSVEFKQTMGGLAGYIAFHDSEGSDAYEDFCVSFFLTQQPCFLAIQRAIEEKRAVLHARLSRDHVVYLAREGAVV